MILQRFIDSKKKLYINRDNYEQKIWLSSSKIVGKEQKFVQEAFDNYIRRAYLL